MSERKAAFEAAENARLAADPDAFPADFVDDEVEATVDAAAADAAAALESDEDAKVWFSCCCY
jgi:hypothetical protein